MTVDVKWVARAHPTPSQGSPGLAPKTEVQKMKASRPLHRTTPDQRGSLPMEVTDLGPTQARCRSRTQTLYRGSITTIGSGKSHTTAGASVRGSAATSIVQ